MGDMKLTVFLFFICFCIIAGIFYLLDKKIYYMVPEKWQDKVFVIMQFFKNLLGLAVVLLVAAWLSDIIAHKDIFTLFCEIEIQGVQGLIVAGLIFFICSFIYKSYRLYQILKDSTMKILRTAREEELRRMSIRYTCMTEQQKRKLSILLKFAPGTIIVILLENLFGTLKQSDIAFTIEYMITNQANIYMCSLLALYLFWLYHTNENLKIIENKVRDIHVELLRRKSNQK